MYSALGRRGATTDAGSRGSPRIRHRTARRDPEHRRVLARGDGLTALDRSARGWLAQDPRRQEIGRDPEPDEREDGHRRSEPAARPRVAATGSWPPGRDIRPRGSGRLDSAPRSATLRSPTIVCPLSASSVSRSRPRRPPGWSRHARPPVPRRSRRKPARLPMSRPAAVAIAVNRVAAMRPRSRPTDWRTPSPGTASSDPGQQHNAHRLRLPPIRRTTRCSWRPGTPRRDGRSEARRGSRTWLISAGSTVLANWPQTGHWKSVQTSSVTGASALPTARPSASVDRRRCQRADERARRIRGARSALEQDQSGEDDDPDAADDRRDQEERGPSSPRRGSSPSGVGSLALGGSPGATGLRSASLPCSLSAPGYSMRGWVPSRRDVQQHRRPTSTTTWAVRHEIAGWVARRSESRPADETVSQLC